MEIWTEIKLTVSVQNLDRAADIVNMTVPYGIYIEDYSNLEQEALEIANIDLIDEELLKKDRTKGIIHIYITGDMNPAEAVSFIENRFTAEKISYTLETANCKKEDWENNWRQYFKPAPVGEKLFIRPVWIDDYNAENRKVINIEPGAAFGTGTHETTRLCLSALENHVKQGSSILDVGCGSGILAVAALLLGAKNAVGVDIDELAVKAAKENGILNGFSEPEYSVIKGDLTDKVTGKYDIVTANIVADAIIALTPGIKNFLSPGGVYIVSGIIDSRASEVIAALEAGGFNITERYEDGGWCCFAAVQ
ncbi:MAG: 50S ribosomal protein L11 methyltransferase [Oscillospiraceae bacterium]|nr:50S ribosomal protein L11 methyltransferase [Oscillospiraceae bacterium]